jgi:hypothetical protein
MIWGIVGHEDAKFTTVTEQYAREAIRALLRPGDEVVSGDCPLGGIDKWSIEEAKAMGLVTREHSPKVHSWDGPGGFKDRNILIAEDCEEAVCIVVRTLPPTYKGRRFPYCYHCATRENPKPTDHVKSGGCWTVNYARKLGKPGRIIII